MTLRTPPPHPPLLQVQLCWDLSLSPGPRDQHFCQHPWVPPAASGLSSWGLEAGAPRKRRRGGVVGAQTAPSASAGEGPWVPPPGAGLSTLLALLQTPSRGHLDLPWSAGRGSRDFVNGNRPKLSRWKEILKSVCFVFESHSQAGSSLCSSPATPRSALC